MAKVNITRNEGESEADFRRRYHREWERLDREAKGIQPKVKPEGPCSVDGCDAPAEVKTMCGRHYRAERARIRKESGFVAEGKRTHPLYMVWYERKKRGGLCPAWLVFEAFAEDVGERPSENHFLARRIDHEDYGPDNFIWREYLRRTANEPRKAFESRKWQRQKEKKPDFDRRRHLVRTYGIDEARYLEMFAEQRGLCFICGEEETDIDKARGVPKSLAVDHHKATGIVRDLLCFRCNSTFGRVGESARLLRAMAEYADRWADPAAKAAELGRPERIEPRQHEVIIESPWGPLPISEAARRSGLKPQTVLGRRAKGWPMEKLLIPLRRPQRLAKSDDQSI